METNDKKNIVLIVEDNYLNRFILGKTLDDLGVPHHECEDGLQAILWLKDTSFTNISIFLDLNMPVLDGYDFLKYLDQNALEFKHLNFQIHILSATSLSEFSQQMPNAKISGFLDKPVDIRHIKNALEISAKAFQDIESLTNVR